MKIHGYGKACSDCLMLLANGETPPELDEDETAEYLARVDSSAGEGYMWAVGGEHGQDCPNMSRGACIVTDVDRAHGWDVDCDDHDHEDGEWIGNTDCDCEDLGFSWSACDVCRSPLGGSRFAVHYFSV